jgi:hypothetical protein
MKIANAAQWLLVPILISSPSYLLAQHLTEPGAPGAKAWGDPVNDLEVSLYFDPKEIRTTPRLRVGFRNIGSSDITVLLGMDCGVDPDQIEPELIELNVTNNQGKSLRLEYNAHTRNCAGVPTPWLEHLPPRTSFSIPINLESYKGWYQLHGRWDHGKWETEGKPGSTYLLEGVLINPGRSQFNVESNQLRVHFPTE